MNNNSLIISKMEISHIEEVLVIEQMCFSLPWTRQSFENELLGNKFAYYHVAQYNGASAGYSGLWKVLDEGHITNIAIHPDYRRRGIGSSLVKHMFDFCLVEKIRSLTLEVRESNIPARNMYKKLGFIEAGIRKAYYQDNNEDAIIMWKKNLGC